MLLQILTQVASQPLPDTSAQLLSDTIWGAIIAACATIIVSVFGVLSNRKNTAAHKQRLELYQYLLANVYQPIYVVYVNYGLSKEFADKLCKVHEEHAAYIPPKIEDLMISLRRDSKNEEINYKDERYNAIRRYIESDYNLIRRHLGLSCKKEHIIPWNISYKETRYTFKGFWARVPKIFLVTSTLLFIAPIVLFMLLSPIFSYNSVSEIFNAFYSAIPNFELMTYGTRFVLLLTLSIAISVIISLLFTVILNLYLRYYGKRRYTKHK